MMPPRPGFSPGGHRGHSPEDHHQKQARDEQPDFDQHYLTFLYRPCNTGASFLPKPQLAPTPEESSHRHGSEPVLDVVLPGAPGMHAKLIAPPERGQVLL